MTTDQLAETTLVLPSLGESVEEATVTRWLKKAGDYVEAEEPLLEVATDKVDTDIPAPVSGILTNVIIDENDVVAVGAPLAVINAAHTATGQATPPSAPVAETASPTTQLEPVPAPTTAAPPNSAQSGPLAQAVIAPPLEQKPMPTETKVARTQAPSDAKWEKLPKIRQTIARAMTESLRTSAQLTTVVEADVTHLGMLRKKHKQAFFERTGVNLSYFPFLAVAAVSALAEHRMLNASLNTTATEVTYHNSCHLGIAVDSPKGLMVPVVRDAQNLNVGGLACAIAALADRVRTGTITADELIGGTFTVTNTGSRGALFDTPIINPPQTGILGTGAVVERLVASRDRTEALEIRARSMVYLSLTYDHRIVDGADAARFLTAIKHRLETGFTATDLA
jgi:2-oxoglutarate dehydrogenase E2 component (dihydrolipoamide succinyltransferase)